MLVGVALALAAGAPPAAADPAAARLVEVFESPTLAALAIETSNPAFTAPVVDLENDVFGIKGGFLTESDPLEVLLFTPGWVQSLNDDFVAHVRPTLPLVVSVPLPAFLPDDRETGFGDVQLSTWIGNNPLGQADRDLRLSWALGPTFSFPTASDRLVGSEKWQVGPSGTLSLAIRDDWRISVAGQQLWSFAGDGDRDETSQLLLRYQIVRSLPWVDGLYLTSSPDVLVDWKQDGDDDVTFPIGGGLGKIWRLPRGLALRVEAEGWSMAVRPDDVAGRRWGARLLLRLQVYTGRTVELATQNLL